MATTDLAVETPRRRASPVVAEANFAAMGSTAHVIVVADDRDAGASLLARAAGRVEELEARWSRFRPASEVTRLNDRRGLPVRVSADTYELVERAVQARDATGNRYDPLVLDAMVQLGYDRDFAQRSDPQTGSMRPLAVPRYQPPAGAIHLDPYVPAVTLPLDAGFDPGGIGKGLAADIVVRELRAAGARGAMVNLGGDLVADGTPPDEHGWIVGIEDPLGRTTHLGRVTLISGAVCTSSPARRRWVDAQGRAVHHLVDPSSGDPVASGLASATVVAGSGWWAEALTKALFVADADAGADAGRGRARDGDRIGALAADLLDDEYVLVVSADGTVSELGARGAFDLAAT